MYIRGSTLQWLKRAIVCALFTASYSVHADLFFSEYVEGSSNNKALEIFNSTNTAVDLSGYEVAVYFNGSSTPGVTLPLEGTLAAGEVHVVSHSSAHPNILAVAQRTYGGGLFNGDDAVALLYGGNPVDVIGQIGVDPGSEWRTEDVSTANTTLRRHTTVTQGNAGGFDAFDPALEWDAFPQDTFDGLGQHAASDHEPRPSEVLINEVDSDTPGTDTQEFVELFDGGIGNTALDGLVLTLFNGSNNRSYNTFDLSGYSTGADGYFVLGNAAVANVDMVIPSNSIQNGADAVALYRTEASTLPNGSALTTEDLVDAIVYGTNDPEDPELLTLLNPGEPQVNESGEGSGQTHSNQRCPNGSGGLHSTSAYRQVPPTPGAANGCAPITGCGSPATRIHVIQGEGASTPLNGTSHSVEGIVVGDFQGSNQLNGFFLQEEDGDRDNNPLTSEGIFIYDASNTVDVAEGDLVRVTGIAREYYNLTQVNASSIEVCPGSGGSIATPATLELPVAERTDLEALEAMAVVVEQNLTVTENYNLGRYGELVLSANGRLLNPTQIAEPGAEANALAAEQALRRILLDDGSTNANPAVIPYPAPELSAYNTVRAGDRVRGLRGVLHYAFDEYRIQPTVQPTFVPENLRTATPDLSEEGSLRVASFNVLNYFNGDGTGGGFPTSRGADTPAEFERQRQKIIAALVAMDADVVGLIEIENDGYGPESAIQDLVNGLNDAGLEYAVVHPGVPRLGSDEIAVGFIYRPETVEPLGSAAILDSSVDARFIDTKNRPVLAQTFREKATDGALTIAVAHLKSKGSNCNDLGDPDLGDGQGNCNLTRTAAAEAMVDWLANDPTQTAEPNKLIIGDLNAYAKEDPIAAIENADFVNLLADFVGPTAYSYVFTGYAGYLDHALANSHLYNQITDVTEWHINADEPRALDYNQENKTPEQVVSLYSPHPYRASDHDPLVVQLNLTSAGPDTISGDFNGDEQLTTVDFRLLLTNLGGNMSVDTGPFDMNADERIGLADAFMWLAAYARESRL